MQNVPEHYVPAADDAVASMLQLIDGINSIINDLSTSNADASTRLEVIESLKGEVIAAQKLTGTPSTTLSTQWWTDGRPDLQLWLDSDGLYRFGSHSASGTTIEPAGLCSSAERFAELAQAHINALIDLRKHAKVRNREARVAA